MNTIIKYSTILLIAASISQVLLKAQPLADEIIFKAMNDELSRNISNLVIDKYRPPFFISFRLCDFHSLYIKATLGAIRYSYDRPARTENVRLMVGDYSLNDENFISDNRNIPPTRGNYIRLPLNSDYDAIRRSFWILSDQVYKSALEKYEQKQTALKQQNKSDEEKLDDYSKITPVSLVLQRSSFSYDKTKWEEIAKNVSGIFKAYNQIHASSTYITLVNAFVYVTTSEGTKLKIPFTLAWVLVTATTQAEDGENLNDQLSYYALTPEQLPSADKIEQNCNRFANDLIALRNAPPMKETYTGPIIFEGEAVAEVFSQRLFRTNGLISSREPIYAIENKNQGSSNKLDDKLNQKICSENINIKATPKITMFNNTHLIGSFEIDAEGVIPQDELVLVDKGILKTLLTDRVPTSKIKQSNGYSRFGLRGSSVITQKAPGIINISYENGEPLKSLYKTILNEAEKNGLEYIYVIRKLEPAGNKAISKPMGVYKLFVKTGEEHFMRSAIISDLPRTAFKQIALGTKEQFVYNTLLNSSVPVSFIVPQAIVFNDMSIEKDKSTKAKVPIVSNPLLVQKQ